MPFQIVRNDIVNMQVDAIVNTANPRPEVGAGTDSRIHEKAGPKLLKARQKIGDIAVGQAAVTRGYELPCKYVIHTVGPVWQGGEYRERELLRSCYDNSLALAVKKGCKSIAFPLISSGNYGFPKDQALQVAIGAFSTFLTQREMDIYLVVFDKTAYQLSEKLFQNITSFIDEHYVEQAVLSSRVWERSRIRQESRRMAENASIPAPKGMKQEQCPAPCMAPSTCSLEDMLRQQDKGFTETLLRLIDNTGKKDSEIYKKANLSKQHFSKIRNDPNYKPKKTTAVALAIALELSLEETRDLIGRAGYALTNSSKFDLIVRFFIEQKNYNIVQINMALYEFDQVLLGA